MFRCASVQEERQSVDSSVFKKVNPTPRVSPSRLRSRLCQGRGPVEMSRNLLPRTIRDGMYTPLLRLHAAVIEQPPKETEQTKKEQRTNKRTNERVNQPTNQPTNQSMNEQFNPPNTKQPNKRTNQPTNQQTNNQQTDQPTDKRINDELPNESTNGPTN